MLSKIYFWILVFIGLIGYSFLGLSRVWEVIDLIVYITSLVGVYGFVWRKKIAKIEFWKVFFPVQMLWNIYYAYFIPLPQKISELDMGGASQAELSTQSLIVYIPMMVMLYFYAYKNEKCVSEIPAQKSLVYNRKKWEVILKAIGLWFVFVSFIVLSPLVLNFSLIEHNFRMYSLSGKIILFVTYPLYLFGLFAGVLGFFLKEVGRKLMITAEILFFILYLSGWFVFKDQMSLSVCSVFIDLVMVLIFLYLLTRAKLKAVCK